MQHHTQLLHCYDKQLFIHRVLLLGTLDNTIHIYIYKYMSVCSGHWDAYAGLHAKVNLSPAWMVTAGSGCGHGNGSAAAVVEATIFSFANDRPPNLKDFDIANVLYLDCAYAFQREDPADSKNVGLKRKLGYATRCDGHNGLVQKHLTEQRNWASEMAKARAHVEACVARHNHNRVHHGRDHDVHNHHHGRDHDVVKVVITCGCVHGRHRSVAMAEMLACAIGRPHIGKATCMHHTLWQTDRGECGCRDNNCQQLRNGTVGLDTTIQWTADRALAHARVIHLWDYE
jgi:hypothetical protein